MDKNEVIKGLAEAIWLNADKCEIVAMDGNIESQEDVEDILKRDEICTSLDDSYFEKFGDYTAEIVDSGGVIREKKHWCNDGNIELQLNITEPMPDSFKKGRLKKDKNTEQQL